jgi:hypothetical protein
MNLIKYLTITVCILGFTSLNFGDVKLDDFEIFYSNNPTQCYLGEAYGYSITKKWGAVDTGNGWWSPYDDGLGAKVTNGQQVNLTDANGPTMVENGALHLFYKTHLSTADFLNTWPYAGIGCDLLKDSLSYFNFSALTEITMKLKGSGKIRVYFETQDIWEMVDSNGVQVAWGYYGFNITLDSTYTNWKELVIPAVLLDPEPYSPAAESLWTWDHGMAAVKGFAIDAVPDEDSLTKDSVELWVDDIMLKGLDYQATFGFVHDTDVAISYHPQNNGKMNVTITPDQYRKSISISYNLEKNSDVSIDIFDTRGRIVSRLINSRQNSGRQCVTTKVMTSGIYFITFKVNNAVFVRKFSYIR